MQTKQTTRLRCAANDYVTLVSPACAKISGFEQLYKEMERAINVCGKSRSTLTNYERQLAQLALHFKCLPTKLDKDQVLDYLHFVKTKGTPSATFFKFTVYGDLTRPLIFRQPGFCQHLMLCAALVVRVTFYSLFLKLFQVFF